MSGTRPWTWALLRRLLLAMLASAGLVALLNAHQPAAEGLVLVLRIDGVFGDVTVDLLSVQPPFSLAEGLLDAPPQRLDHWSQRIGAAAIASARAALPATGVRVREVVRTGEAIEEMNRRADEIDADVIVLGTRGLGALGQALLRSVSGGLLQTGTRTTIVVP